MHPLETAEAKQCQDQTERSSKSLANVFRGGDSATTKSDILYSVSSLLSDLSVNNSDAILR